MADAHDKVRRSTSDVKGTPSPSAPRSARAFLAEGERPFARRDFLARSSVAALVVAAGGVFFASAADASVPQSLSTSSGVSSLGTSTLVQTPRPHAVAPDVNGTGVRVAQTCTHSSHGSHGSHGSHASHGSHSSHGSW